MNQSDEAIINAPLLPPVSDHSHSQLSVQPPPLTPPPPPTPTRQSFPYHFASMPNQNAMGASEQSHHNNVEVQLENAQQPIVHQW